MRPPPPQLGPPRKPARAWGGLSSLSPWAPFPTSTSHDHSAMSANLPGEKEASRWAGRSLFPAVRGCPGASVHPRCLFPTEVQLFSSWADRGPLIR